MKVIVVTGGIGSGKSLVCKMLHELTGWPLYNADGKVKELYGRHTSLLNDIEDALNVELRDQMGNFIPQRLADRIFADEAALGVVESLVFPILLEDFQMWKANNAEAEFVMLESATILEKPQLSGIGDITLVVDASVDNRVARAAARDGAEYDKVYERVLCQKLMNRISMGDVPDCVDFVINNDGDLCELREKVVKFIEKVS